MQTPSPAAQDWTSKGCPDVWWLNAEVGMNNELGVLHRTLGFSLGAGHFSGVHITIPSLALWESFLWPPSLAEDREPCRLWEPTWQIPSYSSLVLAGPCLSRLTSSWEQASARRGQSSPSGILIVFCQEDNNWKIFSSLTMVFWKVH